MDNLNINSKILYTNAKNFGIDLVSMYTSSAKLVTNKLIDKFGLDKDYAIICGLAGNGGDGFAIAQELVSRNEKVAVYIIGRANNIEDKVAFELYNILKNNKNPNLIIKQDCYAEDVESASVILECLVGTGIVGEKLNKRFADVIKRVSHFKKTIIAIDLAAPSYNPDLTISFIYPKTKEADFVEMDLPKQLTMYPGPGEVEVLFKPKKHSYKVKNGKLLYVFNSENYENLYRILKYARDYYVHINIYSPKVLEEEFEKEFITVVSDKDLEEAINSSDLIFMDEFTDSSILNTGLIKELANFRIKKFILSTSSLSYISLNQLKDISEKLFILDKTVVEILKVDSKTDKGYKRIALETKSNIIVPSIQSYLYSENGEFRLDITGKLFNKDLQLELLCLVAVLATKNDIWLSLRAADYLLISI